MKKVLIASFDMEVGGVERSLISMLNNFDYKNNKVDLMLYKHQGDLINLLPDKQNLLEEISEYTTFRKTVKTIIDEKKYILAITRVLANINSKIIGKMRKMPEAGYYQMQLMWKYSLPFLPKLDKRYDVAISYLWPHYFIAEKVMASKKIAWIHTDYSKIAIDTKLDLQMWNKFDYIISISEECTKSFLIKYPSLKGKIILVENITSPKFIRDSSEEEINESALFKDYNFNIVSVGRLCYQKGFDNAILALKILIDKGYKDLKWYIIGYGGEQEKLTELINRNNLQNNFILLGKKVNPYPYIKKCHLYVQPSRYEGKAVTVTEAKILGKPVLITDYPTANSQLINGFDGVICDNSVEGIVNGVENLYKNKKNRDELSKNCNRSDYSNSYELEKLYKLF